MPRFCLLFPWCSPEVFWQLNYVDYRILKPFVDAHFKKATK